MKSSLTSLKPIKVGLLGIGIVGDGTFNVLKRNQEEITRRAGRRDRDHDGRRPRTPERARQGIDDASGVAAA